MVKTWSETANSVVSSETGIGSDVRMLSQRNRAQALQMTMTIVHPSAVLCVDINPRWGARWRVVQGSDGRRMLESVGSGALHSWRIG